MKRIRFALFVIAGLAAFRQMALRATPAPVMQTSSLVLPLPYGQATASGSRPCPPGPTTGVTCSGLVVACPSVPSASATLRITRPASTALNRGTLILTTGGDGANFTDSSLTTGMILTYVADGLVVVQIAWDPPGIWGGPQARTLACRYATAARWIYDNVHAGGRTKLFAAQGTSGGAGQIAFGLGFYGAGDFLDLANLGGGPPKCPVCSSDGQHPLEPLLPSPPGSSPLPLLNYPTTTVRFFLGDQDPNHEGTADNAKAYYDAITSAKSFMIVPNTEHTVESTPAGVEAFVSSVRAALPEIRSDTPLTYTIATPGGLSLTTTGTGASTVVGYARIHPSGSNAPSGLGIFGFRQNDVLVSEAGVPASPLIQSGRIYAEVNGPVNTGLAIANPNSQTATLTFSFADQNGNTFGSGTTTIPANGQTAAFLNQAPFNGGSSVAGAFSFSSSVPVAVVALRGFTNERGEFLITTLPVADLTAAAARNTMTFTHFASGGGWSTQIVLVNTTDANLTGTVQFRDQTGQNAVVTVSGQSNSSFAYSIPARTSQKLLTSGTSSSFVLGSVLVTPGGNTVTPSGLAIFSFRNGGITVAEAGVPAGSTGNAFRLYAEASGDFRNSAVGSIQTGLAVVNTSSSPAAVTVVPYRLDGTTFGLTGTLPVPANGQTAMFLNQIQGLSSLSTPFRGVLRVSSTAAISVVGLRGRYNERGDFLITTTPPSNEATPPVTSDLFFPHFADSGGYTTQFILFGPQSQQSLSGSLQLFSQSGQVPNLALR